MPCYPMRSRPSKHSHAYPGAAGSSCCSLTPHPIQWDGRLMPGGELGLAVACCCFCATAATTFLAGCKLKAGLLSLLTPTSFRRQKCLMHTIWGWSVTPVGFAKSLQGTLARIRRVNIPSDGSRIPRRIHYDYSSSIYDIAAAL